MKKVLLTMQVNENATYPERRDAIDQRWFSFLEACGLFPLLVPNSLKMAKRMMEQFPHTGIILTGGQSLVPLGGDAPERDAVETFLLEHAIQNKVPLIGVCRGMQLLQHHFKTELSPVEGHVALCHAMQTSAYRNSYHRLGSLTAAPEFHICEKAHDGIVEAIQHQELPLFGIMWHPERNDPFAKEDLIFFQGVF